MLSVACAMTGGVIVQWLLNYNFFVVVAFRSTLMGPRSLPWRIPVTMDFAETARSFRPPARARWPRAGLAHMIVADHNGEIRALLRAVRRVLPLEVCHQFRIGTEDCD